jgi:2-iminobutanoate/2-iminopropanoate deaminase
MSKKYINPPDLFRSLQYGFSQIVSATPGRIVFLSGQVAWDAQENLVGPNDLKEQTRQSFRNIERALVAAGAHMRDLVSLRFYIVGYEASRDGHLITEVLKEVFKGRIPPATTWIGVSSLANEGFLIEIEAIAVVEDQQGDESLI